MFFLWSRYTRRVPCVDTGEFRKQRKNSKSLPPAVETVEAKKTVSRIVISPGQPVPMNMMEQEDYQNTRSDAAPFFTTTVDFVSYEVMMLLRMKSVNSRNENYVSDFCSTSQEVYLPQSFC